MERVAEEDVPLRTIAVPPPVCGGAARCPVAVTTTTITAAIYESRRTVNANKKIQTSELCGEKNAELLQPRELVIHPLECAVRRG